MSPVNKVRIRKSCATFVIPTADAGLAVLLPPARKTRGHHRRRRRRPAAVFACNEAVGPDLRPTHVQALLNEMNELPRSIHFRVVAPDLIGLFRLTGRFSLLSFLFSISFLYFISVNLSEMVL